MVMEEHPSPQCVGREFVRQYYTLLNKAPIHLHRFYNNASSFVHGGLDAPDRETSPVVGQKEIHNRIQQLNFRDCHAKISQVDSQATLGNGVVVQVTGELSNGGQPMRRFTQTFVLAAQSPKQYYVHNDIFRYQDFVFSDDDGEWEYSRSTASPPPVPSPAQQVPAVQAPLPIQQQQQQQAPIIQQQQQVPVVQQPQAVVQPQQPPATASLPAPYFPATPQPDSPPPQQQQLNGHQDEQQGNLSMGLGASDSSCGELEVGQELEEEPLPVHHQPAPAVCTEPKTYANLVKSGAPGSFAQAIQQHHPLSVQGGQASRAAPLPSRASEQSVQLTQASSGGSGGSPPAPPQHQRPRPPRTPRTDSTSETGGPTTGGNTPPTSTSGGGRRYSDSQQLFLGNLPHSATKEDLRILFEKFGPIAELRVHSKPAGPGGPGGRVVPNYAFLTFEDTQSAQICLNNGPLYYPSEDAPDAQLLNVQEKKSRPGGGPGGPRGGGAGGGGGGGRGGPRPPRPPFQRGPFQPQRR